MYPKSALNILLLAAAAAVTSAAEETTTTSTYIPACTATSHTNGAFFDLRSDIATAPEEGKTSKGPTSDYHARGYDYGRNFTLNICAPVVEPVLDVVGLNKGDWKNVSAYYTYKGDVFSIGQSSLDLKSHGRKLVLQYTGGSPCGGDESKQRAARDTTHSPDSEHYDAYAREKAEKEAYLKATDPKNFSPAMDGGNGSDARATRRKSATISFHCDPEQVGGQVGVSFVATDPDECAYFFEVRSQHACARAEPHQPGSVGPGSVFAIILIIAVLVYFGGGVFYQRTVAHARGWRQLPNYTLWSGIWNFISDIFIITLSSCARLLPGRRGYRHLSSSPSRGRDYASENRLIDQLDEEWDD
ncbi:mannose-6-phosphate receptor binding domain-containing protein [Plectosphaerella cucumerina]|uniref:Mannose-6-phosphate receptor binding domain-containing protein n=1 Tax=Plectosphaerella cucumerina TaxID=40658 RepID=A0A8K0TPZ0_9PEZI|nr:mannose-6-phosphate receptor binding domain-containing protein [Plectosphaerella cucumerina]